MGPFSTDEKSDKPRPVFHSMEDDHVDRLVATTGALRTKPGNPSTFFDHEREDGPMICEKFSLYRAMQAVALFSRRWSDL